MLAIGPSVVRLPSVPRSHEYLETKQDCVHLYLCMHWDHPRICSILLHTRTFFVIFYKQGWKISW